MLLVGVFGSLLLITRLADLIPSDVEDDGANDNVIGSDWPGDKVAGTRPADTLNCDASLPLRLTLLISKSALPLLVMLV